MFKIVSTSDCRTQARLIADRIGECEILDAESVVADPGTLGDFENLGLVFGREGKGIPASVKSFVSDVLGGRDLEGMQYMFSVCVCDGKPFHALKIVEILCSRIGCAPSLSMVMHNESDAETIACKINDGGIVLAGGGVRTIIYMKRHRI